VPPTPCGQTLAKGVGAAALAAGRGSTAKVVTAAGREGGGPGDGGEGNVAMVVMVAKAAMVAMDGGIYLLNV
jgi:hypothetical protein